MEIRINEREQVQIGDIAVGETFILVKGVTIYERILFDEVVFKSVLTNDVIYCVALDTGQVTSFELNLIVEKIHVTAEEV